MSKELVISATPHETRVAIVEDGQLCEIYVEREKEFALVGSIYKGRVTRVLPGMQSAFVDIGLDGDAFLYVSDFLEDLEEYDHIVSTVEEKVQKMEQQGGQVFAPATNGTVLEPPEVTGPESPEPAPPEPPSSQNSASYGGYENRRFLGGRGRGGRSRGGRRRGGRWDRRGPRDRGRELPPSKFARRDYEPPPADYEPVILPGESLAKYKDRLPAPPVEQQEPAPKVSPAPAETAIAAGAEAPPAEQEHGAAAAPSREPDSETAGPSALGLAVQPPFAGDESAAAAAPETEAPRPAEAREQEPQVFAPPPPPPFEPAVPVRPTAAEHPASEAAPLAEQEESPVTERPASSDHLPEQPPAAPGATKSQPSAEAAGEPDLDEAEASALAQQVVEAREEELQREQESKENGDETCRASGQHDSGEEEDEEEEAGENDSDYDDAGDEDESYPGDSADEQPLHFAEVEGEQQEPAGEEISAGTSSGGGRTVRIRDDRHVRFQRPARRGGRRGGRPTFRPQRPRAPRRTQSISELLKPGQEIIVQIAKEPLGKKGARITSHIALPGRFLVYMPTLDHIGVSRKISSAEQRARLRHQLRELKGSFPGGFIVRTAAAGASEEELRADVEFLGNLWQEIRQRSEARKAPALLHRDLSLVERVLRDQLSGDFTALWVDSEEEFTRVVEFVNRFQPRLVNRVKLYSKDAPIFEEFGIQAEIDKALRPKVWLRSGGYIVINHTEALVAIDVNTGKFVGKGSTRLEDTIVKTNLEAVKEIVRQIRLRDLGGIIVIDFIDMEERKNRSKVMQALEEALRSDKAPSKVLSFNEFGLVAITRKRTKQALERVLTQPCPYCSGSGMVKSIPTICYEIQMEARKMAPELDTGSLTLRVHPEIAKALKTRESTLIEELERWTRKSVIIQSDPTLHWEQYDIY